MQGCSCSMLQLNTSEQQIKLNPSICVVYKSFKLSLLIFWCPSMPKTEDVSAGEVVDCICLIESSQLGVQAPCFPKTQSPASCNSF